MTEMTVIHCPCGTGCADCYGKLHCGCPDCYVPPQRKRKKVKVKKPLTVFEMSLREETTGELCVTESVRCEVTVSVHYETRGMVATVGKPEQVLTETSRAQRRRSEIIFRNTEPTKVKPKVTK